MMERGIVRGRLAPSPTGALHLGNARSFLLAWLAVRSQGGKIVLRIEDLDHPKVKRGAVEEILEDLRWLGIDWDEGPFFQTERIALYRGALEKLFAAKKVYPCVCTRRDVLAGQSAPHAEDHELRYDGHCRGKFRSYEEAAAIRDVLPAWRFCAEDYETTFEDLIAGVRRENVARRDGDFVIARHPDGAGYMLASVVDDALMGINQIVRGDDLIPATHRQLQLIRALGFETPQYAHAPLVVGEDGRRLAKRHGDTRLKTLRQEGIKPERVVALLAEWSGFGCRGEKLRPCDLIERFDFAKLSKEKVVWSEAQKCTLI